MLAFDWTVVEAPGWYSVAGPATLILAFIAVFMTKYVEDPRVLAALPLLGNTFVSAYGSWMLLKALGYFETAGVVARSAGAIELIENVIVGAVASSILATVTALWTGNDRAWTRRTRLGDACLMLGAAAVVVWVAFVWYLTQENVGSKSRLETAAIVLTFSSGAITLLALLGAVWGKGSRSHVDGRRWFIRFAAASASLAAALAYAAYSLQRFIDKGATGA